MTRCVPFHNREAKRAADDPTTKRENNKIKQNRQSLKAPHPDLIMSAVALNVCKNDPGQYTNTHTYPHNHTQNPEAAMTIHNTLDDLIGPPSLNPPAWIHGSVHAHMQRDKERKKRIVV